MTILFWHRKSKADKNGYAPVICRITVDGQDEEFSTTKKVHLKGWDMESKRATGGLDFKSVNSSLNDIQYNLETHFNVLRTSHETITPLMLKNVYKSLPPYLSKNETAPKLDECTPSLLELASIHITEFTEMVESGKRSPETLKQWKATEKKLNEFIPYEFKRQDLLLSEIEYSFAQKFYRYLTVKRIKKLNSAAAMKQIKNTKQLLNVAEANDWVVKNPIEKFRCGSEDPEILPLEPEEVEKLWRKVIPIERLAKVRDAFVFQCFTGFAYQDIYNLTPQHIKKVGLEREKWLIKERGKTKVVEMVPVLPIVEEIIDKYSEDPYCIMQNCLVPVNSNYRYNCYLKELADLCGIKRNLNTHLARHTFADIMLNVLEFPLEDVSKMLGHKNIRTTQRYARIKKRRIGNKMRETKSLLFEENGQLKMLNT